MSTVEIATRRRPLCPICGGEGPVFFRDVSDRLFGVPGKWTSRRCTNTECQTVWLDPCPIDQDIPKLYSNYYTHSANDTNPIVKLWKWMAVKTLPHTLGYQGGPTMVGRLLAPCGPLREALNGHVMWVPGGNPGRLLDVGCGDGQFLATMRQWGWQVTGVEPDPAAAGVAHSRGLDVRIGTVSEAGLEFDSYDVVTLSHVIEHVPDPVSTLRACTKLLKPGGVLHATTPNAGSDGAIRFGPHWRGWECPRHLLVFCKAGLLLAASAAGLTETAVTTPARLAWLIARISEKLAKYGTLPGGRCPFEPWRVPAALMFHLREYRRARRQPVGEELLLVARRPM
jgi:2-polyprenyl-3-methyl-5-hydroxy-6-metoxy-1,4-benzoquinol methylase